jgi:Na+/H+ antiporter NhaD/arsenite permease-like protein
MLTIIAIVFTLSYLAIALEHPLKISKSASALMAAGWLWTIYALGSGDIKQVNADLNQSLMGTAQIVFFLMGAMTIVEVVDAHEGFLAITSRIKTKRLSSLMWTVGFVTFFLSAILDNLTTTIVMVSLMKKLLEKREDRIFFAGIIVIAANAGGAWTPIGDVTTTMLWIGGQITTLAIIKSLFLASMVNLLVPLTVTSYLLGARSVVAPVRKDGADGKHSTNFERNLMLFLGLAILVGVPAFKTVTHLPPFMGILFGLGMLWMVGDLLHLKKERSNI